MAKEGEYSCSNSYESLRKLDPSSSRQRWDDISISGISHQVKKRGLDSVVSCCPGLTGAEGHRIPSVDVAWTLAKSGQVTWGWTAQVSAYS